MIELERVMRIAHQILMKYNDITKKAIEIKREQTHTRDEKKERDMPKKPIECNEKKAFGFHDNLK